uniref:O-fucosyltransferase family protein n=1 Tax=Solanum tuberosum TaxID=4113 RepID=M1D1G2_SOLTU
MFLGCIAIAKAESIFGIDLNDNGDRSSQAKPIMRLQKRVVLLKMQKKRWRKVSIVRKMLTFAIAAIALMALLYVHVEFPASEVTKLPDKLPTLDVASRNGSLEKLWKPPPNRDHVPCVAASPLYTQKVVMLQICDMVAVARIINATLVIPELDKRSLWQDSSNFSDVFDEDHFINSLKNDVNVIKKLPKELASATKAVKHFRSWSGVDYYEEEIARLWDEYQIIRAAKSDSRLANNNLPPDIQKLRCRACYEALRFAPKIEAMGKMLVDRMRSYGPYIALHLRFEKDMLAFSGCTHDLSPEEAEELKAIRENTTWWKVKEIDPVEQRSKGYCPLTPREVGLFLSALGFPSNTPIYIAAGEIYGGDSHMSDLLLRYPLLMNKEKLASIEELEPFVNHASQLAALDYIVSIESDIFIPTRTLVRLFDKIDQGTMKEGKNLSNRIIEIHRRRYVKCRDYFLFVKYNQGADEGPADVVVIFLYEF